MIITRDQRIDARAHFFRVKPADVQRLYARIKHAAQDVCRNYQWSPVQQDCYEAAVTEAVAKVHEPLLSALVERRSVTGRSNHAGA